ncbi:hypothetical protein [Flavobacterium urocaniciphilum]|nr:hypothetical protein [Flavobacterium urocaniciphilum]
MKYLNLFLFALIFSCNNSEKSNNLKKTSNSEMVISRPLEFSKKTRNSLLLKAINQKDTLAYKKLSNFYLANDRADEFYVYAFIMATEHNYPKAYYDLYESLMFASVYINQFKRENSKKVAIYYLLKSAELNYKGGKNHLAKYFKNVDDIPSSKDYWLKEVESKVPN